MDFENIILENEQKELLITLVEASRKLKHSQRKKFIVARNSGGDFLIHPGVKNNENKIYYGDVEVLASNGLINLGFSSKGSPNFDVTPIGFRYYEYLKQQLGQPVDRVEKTIMSLIDSEVFRSNYPIAYQKWSLAEEMLWSSETEENYSTIGHHCREALQEFAEVLTKKYDLDSKLDDKAKTIGRVQAVLEIQAQKLGKSHMEYLDSLLSLYRSTNSLVQRQEHAALKEGEELVWEDARRVVFAVLFIMYEINQAIP